MTPTLDSIVPSTGPTSGGDLVTIRGSGFAPRVAVRFGDLAAEVVSVRDAEVHVHTPPHVEGTVDVTLTNLDLAGVPVPGEAITAAGAYRFLLPRIVHEADFTRLVRTLLRELKRQVLENVSLSVAVDFDDDPLGTVDLTAIAKLPSLVLSGPRIKENRFYSSNELGEEVVMGASGPEIRRRLPPFTVDIEFGLTGASDRAVELLNLMAALATFFNSNPWLEMDRDPANLSQGTVRWELAPSGELHTNLEGKDDVRAFSWGLVIRGFDIHEGLPLDLGKAVGAAGAELAVGTAGASP